MKSISILGCGWLGEKIGLSFIKEGVSIKGSSRNTKRFEYLKSLEIDPFFIEMDDCKTIESTFFDSNLLIVSTTNKNVSSHQKFIQFLIKNHPSLPVIFVSSTSVYENSVKEIQEDFLLNQSALSEIEQIYSNSRIPTVILRLGGLVGEDRHPGSFFKENRIIKNAETNLIHERDIFKVIRLLVIEKIFDGVFNLVSDEHPKKLDFYTKAFFDLHKKNASFIPSEQESVFKIISNQKIKERIGVELKLSNYFPFI